MSETSQVFYFVSSSLPALQDLPVREIQIPRCCMHCPDHVLWCWSRHYATATAFCRATRFSQILYCARLLWVLKKRWPIVRIKMLPKNFIRKHLLASTTPGPTHARSTSAMETPGIPDSTLVAKLSSIWISQCHIWTAVSRSTGYIF